MAEPGVNISTASADDLDELLRLEHASFPPEDVFSRRQYRDLLANPRATIRVIVQRTSGEKPARRRQGQPPNWQPRRIIAAAVLLRRDRSARLHSIAVDPCCRGQRLGGRLLSDVIDIVRRERLVRLSLEVRADNLAAIALYRRFGFAHAHDLPDYYGPGVPGVKMTLNVGDARRLTPPGQ